MAKLTRRGFLLATGWVAGGATLLYIARNRAVAAAPTMLSSRREWHETRAT